MKAAAKKMAKKARAEKKRASSPDPRALGSKAKKKTTSAKAVKKTAKKKVAAKTAVTKKTAAKKKVVAKKAATKKATAKKKTTEKKAVAKKSVTKKSVTKKKATANKSQTGAPAPAIDFEPLSRRAVRAMYKKLVDTHPDAHCELDHESPFQLVVATALSAQSTDVQVNKVTPGLFKKFPTPKKLAAASQEQVEETINRLGMFRQKSKNLIGLAKKLEAEHGGEVPADQDKLVELPGVGRKTANVVLGVAFNAPVGVVVDTHVQRITQRLGWTKNTTPEKIERDLMDLLPRSEWDRVSHTLIFHGRRVCDARKPACSTCSVNRTCVHAFHAEEVGRKPKKVRTK